MTQKIGESLATIGVDQTTCTRIQSEGDQLHKALCGFGRLNGGEKGKVGGLLADQVSSLVTSYIGELNEDQKTPLHETIKMVYETANKALQLLLTASNQLAKSLSQIVLPTDQDQNTTKANQDILDKLTSTQFLMPTSFNSCFEHF